MFTQTVTLALSRLGLEQGGTDPYPRQLAPMLLQKADAMFASPDWTYETSCIDTTASTGPSGGLLEGVCGHRSIRNGPPDMYSAVEVR
jgi:hypothetical protein